MIMGPTGPFINKTRTPHLCSKGYTGGGSFMHNSNNT